jgi:DNA-binding NarL/FixJ family response regulator
MTDCMMIDDKTWGKNGLDSLSSLTNIQDSLRLITVDTSMRQCAVELVTFLRRNAYKGGILVIGSERAEHKVEACLAAGADEFFDRDASMTEFCRALSSVMAKTEK